MFYLKEKILDEARRFIHLPITGLDISDRSFKYFQFGAERFSDPACFGEVEIPIGILKKGEIKREEDLIRIFKNWLGKKEGKKIRSSFAAVSLPEEKSFLRLLRFPKIKEEEIKEAIDWEIEANIPLPKDQMYFGYEVINPMQERVDHLDVLVTAFSKEIVDSYLRVLKAAGFRVLALELECQALVRAVLKDVGDYSAKIIVDMGQTRTNFITFSAGIMSFTSTLEMGGDLLEQNLIRELGVDKAKAEELKREVGLGRYAYEEKVFLALAPAISVLADELKRAIAYYKDHSEHMHGVSQEVQGVLLAGGGANLPGLDTYLASSLKIPVSLAEPLEAKDFGGEVLIPNLPKGKVASFATAIGLAKKELD